MASSPRHWLDKALPLAIVLLIATLGIWFITVGQQPGGGLEASADTGRLEPELALTAAVPDDTQPVRQDDPRRADEFRQLVEENRKLDASVEALEQETMDLEREMLELDLQIATMSTPEDEVTETAPPAHLSIEIDERSGTLASGVNPSPSAESDYAGESDELATASYAPGESTRRPTAEDLLSDEPFLPDATLDMFTDANGAAADDTAQALEITSVESDRGAARAEASASLGPPVERLVVYEVPPGSLGERSLLVPGDLLLAIDGLPLTGFDDLESHDAGVPNEMHDVEILRDEQRMHVTVVGSPIDLWLRSEWVDPASLIE